ncbi:hypothetical protein H4R20_004843 [Coemansia guatemalensis]|uniref:Uncharacterized protein n=1 Tax=Coemansia guatemalensis TaxID=2761395 RepID=A0A9W8LSF3_9FUNG|nr:hypothetical protein H4R20_004843 [Coemansia guatemalensis]
MLAQRCIRSRAVQGRIWAHPTCCQHRMATTTAAAAAATAAHARQREQQVGLDGSPHPGSSENRGGGVDEKIGAGSSTGPQAKSGRSGRRLVNRINGSSGLKGQGMATEVGAHGSAQKKGRRPF